MTAASSRSCENYPALAPGDTEHEAVDVSLDALRCVFDVILSGPPMRTGDEHTTQYLISA